ncbi:MAG: response regulator [Labilithrix sp.]|nr:response regulator [Labilithrix sp.]MCW5812506.1 response regulator [Labilithrix sp.]
MSESSNPVAAKELRVLFVEDSEDDEYFNRRALEQAGFRIAHSARVETEADLDAALTNEEWDVVLSDYAMPEFSAPRAYEVLRRHALDVPFIVVSGTVGEDTAVEMMKRGAHDYIVKGRLTRLGPAVERELRSTEARRVQKRAQAELQRIEERNRVLLAHSSDAISIVDAAGVIRYVSAPIAAIVGYAPHELVGRPLTETVCDEDRPDVVATLARARAEVAQVTFEARLQHKDGSLRYVEVTVRDFLHDPTIGGLVATTRDISQRRAMDEERRARLHAELANKTKSSFLANMSHELRTPLNAIIGFSELMETGLAGPLSPKQTSYVDNVLQAGRHLLRLVNDILDLSKVEAGKLTLTREWTSLADVVAGVGEMVAPLLRQADLRFEVEVPPALSALYVDPLRLKQILFNLVSNGIKFTKPGGVVRVAARTVGRRIEIDVADTGIGVAAKDLHRLFQEFERVESSGAAGKKAEGTGLGLALTKRLVELHGGTIAVRSEAGVGTTFTITLPDVRRPAHTNERPSLAPKTVPNVLIVDDDPQASALIAQHVRGAGFQPLFAQTAEEALRIAAVERPAVVTLDIMMPNIDGWAILECLRHDPSTADIPAIVISVIDDRPRSLALGAIAHLTKPVSRDELHDVLKTAGKRE